MLTTFPCSPTILAPKTTHTASQASAEESTSTSSGNIIWKYNVFVKSIVVMHSSPKFLYHLYTSTVLYTRFDVFPAEALPFTIKLD